jgi:hypothetical protein
MCRACWSPTSWAATRSRTANCCPEHRRSRYLNRAENSHQPTRERERAMKRFASPRQAQWFLSAFSGITPHFRLWRHLLTAAEWRREMTDRFAVWIEITGLSATASTGRLQIPSPDPHAAIRLGPS